MQTTQLYQLYTCGEDCSYPEYSTKFILTEDRVADLMCDEDFMETFDYMFEEILSYSLQHQPSGRILISIYYKGWCGDDETVQMSLIPVKSFI